MQVLHSESPPFPLKQKHMLFVALGFCCSCKKREKPSQFGQTVCWKSLHPHTTPPWHGEPQQCSSQKETLVLDVLHFRTGGPKLSISMHPPAAVCRSCKNRAFWCVQISADRYGDRYTRRNKRWGRLAWRDPPPVQHELEQIQASGRR